jgi:hypothetical protein
MERSPMPGVTIITALWLPARELTLKNERLTHGVFRGNESTVQLEGR